MFSFNKENLDSMGPIFFFSSLNKRVIFPCHNRVTSVTHIGGATTFKIHNEKIKKKKIMIYPSLYQRYARIQKLKTIWKERGRVLSSLSKINVTSVTVELPIYIYY